MRTNAFNYGSLWFTRPRLNFRTDVDPRDPADTIRTVTDSADAIRTNTDRTDRYVLAIHSIRRIRICASLFVDADKSLTWPKSL